jgi:hypothetical protein
MQEECSKERERKRSGERNKELALMCGRAASFCSLQPWGSVTLSSVLDNTQQLHSASYVDNSALASNITGIR